MNLTCLGIVAVLCLLFLTRAWAQTTPEIPVPVSVFSPGIVKKRLIKSSAPALPRANIENDAAQTPNILPGAEKIRFYLKKVIISGNSRYSTTELETIFKPLLNREISLAELQKAAYAITQKYRNAGYILSRAYLPPQRIEQGIVQIYIVEGFVSQVEVTGDPGRTKTLLQRYGAQVVKARPLQIKTLEHYLLLMNNVPGTEVRAVLTPSATVPDSAILNLVAEQRTAQGYISFDNYGTRYLGPQQISMGGSLNSLLVPGDNSAINLMATPDTKQLKFIQLSHSEPLGSTGARWSVNGSYTKTQPGFLLEPFEIEGTSKSLQADVSYPLLYSREKTLLVHAAADYDNNSSMVLGEQLYSDRLRSLLLGGNYEFADSWHGVNNNKLDIEHGFNILGAGNGGSRSRPEGRSDFTKVNFNISRLQLLGPRFSVLVAAQSQYTNTPLLSSEEFVFGGPDFGRGYDPAEITGDKGVAGKMELRFNTQPDLRLLRTVQYYVFYDAGKTWNLDRVAAVPVASAVSAGLGARFNFNKYLSGDCFIAKPLTRPVAAMVAAGEDGNGPRTFFQLRTVF